MHLVDATVFFSPTSGGVKRYLTAKHAWLKQHTSFEHTIVVPGREDRLVRGGTCTLAGFPVPWTFNYRLPFRTGRWRSLLEQLEPTLIEAGDPFQPAWAALTVARRLGVPTVAFYHSNLPQIVGGRLGGRLAERALRNYIAELYAHFDVVLAPSRLMCEYLGDVGVHSAVHQPLGVDAEVFNPIRRTADVRARLGLDPDTRLLVYAGRFSGEKNLPILYEAFRRLGRRYQLLLIGSNRRARLQPNVTVIPYTRDSLELAGWLASCDGLVHAGTKETFGLVILEAMACGRPVVAARAGAFPEFVDSSVGVLAEPYSAAGMAEAILELYDRDIEALGAAARTRVLRRFTWARTLRAQTDLYEALVGRSQTAAAGAPLELR